MIGEILIAAITGVAMVGMHFNFKAKQKRHDASIDLRNSIIRTKKGLGRWVKRGNSYEYFQNDILLNVKRITANGTSFKISAYYKSELIFEGYHYKGTRYDYTYHWEKENTSLFKEEVESEEFYNAIMKMMGVKKQKDSLELHIENILKKHREQREKLRIESLIKQLEKTPVEILRKGRLVEYGFEAKKICTVKVDNSPNGININVYLDNCFSKGEKEILHKAIMMRVKGLSVRNILKEEEMRKKEEELKKDIWDNWIDEISREIERIDKNSTYLNDEEKHKLNFTYFNDLKDLKNLYENLNEESKKEMEIKIEEGIDKIKQEVRSIDKNIEVRKKKEIETKIQVIKSR